MILKERYKSISYVTNTLCAFVMAFTTPTTNLYFMSKVDKDWFVVSTLMTTIIMAICQSLISKEKVRGSIRNKLFMLIVFDAILYITVSIFTVDYVNFRFILIALLTAANNVIIFTLFTELVNGQFHDVELTNYRSNQTAYKLWGAVIGSILALILPLTLDHAIYIECAYYIFSVGMDKYLISIMNRLGKNEC